MALGNKCPSCGEQTFHKKKGVYKCSHCKVVGWVGAPESPGGGKGAKCQRCEESTVKTVAEKKGVTVRYCFACSATYLE